MKPNKQFIMLGAMIAVIVIIYIITTIFKKNGTKKDNKTNDSLKDDGRVINQTTNPTGSVNQTVFPIKRGSQGQHVLYLQKALNIIANKREITFIYNGVSKAKIDEDSAFGRETEAATKQLYGIVEVSKFMAKQMAKDTGNSSLVLIINQIQ